TLFANIILSNAEIGGLYESALARPAGAVVEVGRFAGGSTMILAQAGRDTGRRGVFSIDIERLSSGDYLLNLNGFTSADTTLIDHDARTVAQCWSAFGDDRGVAFLFIDADHSYDGVRRDLEAWIPLLRPGAMVAFHDLSIPGYGVSRAVYEHVYCNPDFVEF